MNTPSCICTPTFSIRVSENEESHPRSRLKSGPSSKATTWEHEDNRRAILLQGSPKSDSSSKASTCCPKSKEIEPQKSHPAIARLERISEHVEKDNIKYQLWLAATGRAERRYPSRRRGRKPCKVWLVKALQSSSRTCNPAPGHTTVDAACL